MFFIRLLGALVAVTFETAKVKVAILVFTAVFGRGADQLDRVTPEEVVKGAHTLAPQNLVFLRSDDSGFFVGLDEKDTNLELGVGAVEGHLHGGEHGYVGVGSHIVVLPHVTILLSLRKRERE